MKLKLALLAFVGAMAIVACSPHSPSKQPSDPTATPRPLISTDILTRYSSIPQSMTPEGYGILGQADATLELREYSSFACSHCKDLQSTLHELLPFIQNGHLRLVFIPIYNVAGLGADEGSRATICAGEQGRYFEMHDTLFFYQALIAYTREDMRKFALALGLDESAFVRCYEADETRLISQMGRAEFDRQQFIATPTLLLDGQVVKRDELLALLQTTLATP